MCARETPPESETFMATVSRMFKRPRITVAV
jgi:hypothetical protein